jgi:kumamolisin
VADFAKSQGLDVLETDAGRRSVVVRGTAAAVNKAFDVELHDYESPRGKYRSHSGAANLPENIANLVEGITGLDTHKVPAQHFSTARRKNPSDPPQTQPLTPQQVAQLYDFPAGNGTGQTIGIYEMETGDGPAGYTASDLASTMNAFGGGLTVPVPIDVSIDGVTNSGQSDGETGLDITVASAIAQGAQIAVYFTGGTTQNIIHALQHMIHPGSRRTATNGLSISYGWGPDDPSAASFSQLEYNTWTSSFRTRPTFPSPCWFRRAIPAHSSRARPRHRPAIQQPSPGFSPVGAPPSATSAEQHSPNTPGTIRARPAPEPAAAASARASPSLTTSRVCRCPKRNGTGTAGRGIPDIAGNASENSGYIQFINGSSQPVGGTSAVAPLYAGLIAVINANLGHSVGFLNPTCIASMPPLCSMTL